MRPPASASYSNACPSRHGLAAWRLANSWRLQARAPLGLGEVWRCCCCGLAGAVCSARPLSRRSPRCNPAAHKRYVLGTPAHPWRSPLDLRLSASRRRRQACGLGTASSLAAALANASSHFVDAAWFWSLSSIPSSLRLYATAHMRFCARTSSLHRRSKNQGASEPEGCVS